MTTWQLIKSDWKTYKLGGFLKTYLLSPSFHYTFWLRLCHSLKKSKLLKYTFGAFAYLNLRRLSIKYGVNFSTNIEIGHSLHIIHIGNIYINVTSIGNNFTVYQGVTLGSNKLGKNKGVPTIKDNVTIFPNSVIFGDVVLNRNSIIGAGSIVTKDVPENSVVAGAPARVIRMNILERTMEE